MSRGHLAAAAAAIALALGAPSAAHADSFPLVGWWPMNEGAGQTVRDWSGRGNNGYLGSTAATDDNDPQWIDGVFRDSALRFFGDDYVTIPSSSSLKPQSLTVGAWVRFDSDALGGEVPGIFKYPLSMGGMAATSAPTASSPPSKKGCSSTSPATAGTSSRRPRPERSGTVSGITSPVPSTVAPCASTSTASRWVTAARCPPGRPSTTRWRRHPGRSAG